MPAFYRASFLDFAVASDSELLGRLSLAYARVGYHRSLDMLRRNGWKGHGPVPWEHEPNRGFLRALNALSVASGLLGDQVEADRCAAFLRDSDPAAVTALDG